MNRDQKAAVIEQIATEISEAEAIFAVDYRGLSVPQAAELRTRLREADATFRVVKNSLSERAADQAGAESLKELFQGPTALAFVRGDAAMAAKALADYARASDLLPFKGGRLGDEVLDAEQIRAISRLPSRETLYGQLVGIVASPVSGLVRTLNALIGGLAIQLGQISEKKASGEIPAGEPPEAEATPEAPADAAPAEVATEEAPVDSEEAAPAPEAVADAPEAAADADAPDQTSPDDAPADNDNPADASGPADGDR